MSEEQKNRKEGSPWGKVFWMFVILIVAAFSVFASFVWLGKHGIDSTRDAVVDIVTAFKADEVVETFAEWRELQAKGTDGNILEVATATSTERFTRETSLEMFGAKLPLGTTVSEVSIPATYRFHIDLNGEWFVTADGNRLLVIAPDIAPSLPVAFDTGKMEKKTSSGWARWDKYENLAALEKTVTGQLNERASRPATIAKVRDESRLAVAKFLKTWLLAQEGWGDGRIEEISVVFSGEKGKVLSSQPPTLTWEASNSKKLPQKAE